MDSTSLPRRSQELLADGLDQAAVVVADDQPDAGQSTLDEAADEGRPGTALVVAGREVESEHAPLAGRRHAGRDEGRHRHDPPALADLDVGGIEPQIGVRLVTERAGAERLDLGVERRADPADLTPAERGDAEGLDEILDPPRRHAEHIGLLDDREEGSLGPPARLQEAREVRAVANARDGQVHRAHPSVPAPVAIPVAAGQSTFRVALTLGYPGQFGDLGLHDRVGEHPDALPQEVGIALGDRLADRLEHGHPVLGHCGLPSCRRFLLQRREDDAVAVSVLGLPAVTPTLGTQPSGDHFS